MVEIEVTVGVGGNIISATIEGIDAGEIREAIRVLFSEKGGDKV